MEILTYESVRAGKGRFSAFTRSLYSKLCILLEPATDLATMCQFMHSMVHSGFMLFKRSIWVTIICPCFEVRGFGQ